MITTPSANRVPDLTKPLATTPVNPAFNAGPSILCLLCEYGCTCPLSWWCQVRPLPVRIPGRDANRGPLTKPVSGLPFSGY